QDFDIHMNLTLEDAEDISDGKTVKLGKILLRGDNILAVSLPDEES
ncbi:MAG: ribonucleoprotein, partial [Nitrosopumilales archaeon CG11_big_fil_rev_8_21_14_0_20_33_24]